MSLTDNKGFTLLEMVAAMAIFSVMAVLAYSGLNQLIRSDELVSVTLQRMGELQKGVFRIQNDIEQIRLRPVRDDFGDDQAAFLARDEEGLVFTRGGYRNPLSDTRSALQRVGYRLVDGNIIRYSWPNLDRAQESEPLELVLIQNVEELIWRYMDTERDWHDQWPPLSVGGGFDSQSDLPVPLAVEMIMVTEGWGELRFVFRLTTAGAA